ncbi:hypothetical protein MTR_8g089970 [Medicago truncatula]|uniref:Uncharacterized protein n=1 Tax=Medicago truncatula TaxID=3880 RepID=A0A072TV95_MEDTR|nr:hypothetical protein MTR_8g089970 [Medicago truncatula]
MTLAFPKPNTMNEGKYPLEIPTFRNKPPPFIDAANLMFLKCLHCNASLPLSFFSTCTNKKVRLSLN